MRLQLPQHLHRALTLLLLVGLMLLWPWSARAVPVDVAVAPGLAEQGLGSHLQMHEDPGGQQTLSTLPQTATAWQAWPTAAVNFGFSSSSWWTRVRLHNPGPAPLTRVLDLDSALVDQVDIHVLRPDGTPLEHHATGDRRPFSTRPVAWHGLVVPLSLQAGETIDIYMRFQAHDGLHEIVMPKLWTPRAFSDHVQTETLTYGLYYGVLLTVLLYNLFLFVSTRQPAFGYYVVYVTCILLWSSTFRGHAFQYLWPDWPTFNNQALPAFASLSYVTLSLFFISYLDTARSVPLWLHRSLVFCTGANMLGILPTLYDIYALAFVINTLLDILLMACWLVIDLKLLLAGSRPARYFAYAFTTLTVGVLLYYLRVLGLVPANAWTDSILQIGSATEALLLALGLADQMNTLKSDKLRAEQQALAAQTTLNTQLESLVSSRTAELERANERLASLAITDELTGVYNRRQFNKDLAAAMALHARHQSAVALCLIDVDHFKAFNDRYGHPAGDDTLQRIAATVQRRLHRASDHVYRVGGEEFAILLDINEPPDKVCAFIEQVGQAIEKLAIQHEGSPHAVVTVSLGLVILTPRARPMSVQELYSAADSLLYQAKNAGRKQVKTQVLS